MPLVPTAVAAAQLGISERTLSRWAHSGWLPADLRTRGGQYRWDVARVRAELERRYREQLDERRRDEE